MKNNITWSDAEIKAIKDMLNKNWHYDHIANHMGLTTKKLREIFKQKYGTYNREIVAKKLESEIGDVSAEEKNGSILCFFYNGDGECGILTDEKTSVTCSGYKTKTCNFYKTTQQFIDDNDRTIFVCRQKGLCNNCKYREVKCKLSMEG